MRCRRTIQRANIACRDSVEPPRPPWPSGRRAVLVVHDRESTAQSSSLELGGQRTGADAGRIGLEDAQHAIDARLGGRPRPGKHLPPVVEDDVTNGYVP